MDADGSIYVTGETDGEGQGVNVLLRKYSPAGALRWTKIYNRTFSGGEGGDGVAVAADGSIYVTGWIAIEGQSENLLLQKYK